MKGEGTVFLMICPPRHKWLSCSLKVGRLIHPLTIFPKVGTPEAKPSKRVLAADWVPSGDSCLELSPFLGLAHSLYPKGHRKHWQLLAGLVLPEPSSVIRAGFFSGKYPLPSSVGMGSQRAQWSSHGLRKIQDARSFFLPHSWAQAVCPPRVGPEGCILVGLQPGRALLGHLQAPAQGWHPAALHLFPPGP